VTSESEDQEIGQRFALSASPTPAFYTAGVHIAVVGPTHPLKGGVAQHTTVLAQRLAAAGHHVELVSWRRQYPQLLYPGRQTVTEPEFTPFEPTRRPLSWNRPDTWWRAARRLRSADVVIFAHITPVQVPPYRVMLRALRGTAERVVICHNVLPHERSAVDRFLVSSLLDASDRVIVHSEQQARIARTLTATPIVTATMAPSMPEAFVRRAPLPGEHRRLLFFGLVRHYKGLDVLLRALAQAPSNVRLRVAGEFWRTADETIALCRKLGISDRVEIINRYVPASEVPGLFADVDALVLPYRSATGSWGVWTGFEFGVPVIATNAGRLADDIRPGVDGLVVEPDNVADLAAAIRAFYEPGVPERMRAHVKPVDPDPYWRRYLEALLQRGTDVPSAGIAPTTSEGTPVQHASPPGGRLLHLANWRPRKRCGPGLPFNAGGGRSAANGRVRQNRLRRPMSSPRRRRSSGPSRSAANSVSRYITTALRTGMRSVR
jgi:glycosyltransferase involved in cell wall biosynthesis